MLLTCNDFQPNKRTSAQNSQDYELIYMRKQCPDHLKVLALNSLHRFTLSILK